MADYEITSTRGRAKNKEAEEKRRKAIGEATRRRLNTPDGIEKHKQMARATWQNPEIREKRIKALRAAWERPEVRDKRLKALKERRSEISVRLWQNESYRVKQKIAQSKAWQNEEIRERRSKGISEALKHSWSDPVIRQRRLKILRAIFKKYDDPYRAKLANNAQYRARRRNAPGFATPEQVSARVAFYGWRCWICGAPYEAIDHVIPLSKGGSHWPSNLRPICNKCNSRKGARFWWK